MTPQPDMALILRYLNDTHTRATYGAVGGVLGIIARSVSRLLDKKNPTASWVVSSETGLPTGYDDSQLHPNLLDNPHIITSPEELRRRVQQWLAAKPPS